MKSSTKRISIPRSMSDGVWELKRGYNTMQIGDLHAPFIRPDYLPHCLRIRDKYNIDEVMFMGDQVDNHFSSFHVTDPDGFGAGEELERAIAQLEPWYKEFPEAKVMIGNHDRIPERKIQESGLSKLWLRNISEVLGYDGWNFVDHYLKDDVLYVHGDGAGQAINRAKKELISIVQGHWHSQAYAQYLVGRNYKIFGMQVGCGVDDKSYAMAYGKNGPRSAIGCGVVLDGGRLPIVELMEL